MSLDDKYIIRGKFILSISISFIIIAIGLFIYKNIDFKDDNNTFIYESIDIKTMGVAKVSHKKVQKDNIFSATISNSSKNSTLKEVTLENKNTTIIEPAKTTKVEQTSVPKVIWRLPTERGYITQYAHYNHIALDITSPRGTSELIYPIADGTVTSIFHDTAGAKIVTVNHFVNGKYYTSQYVHLSRFAPDIYVGKKVTTNNPLGSMGATGIATGVHLHLTVMDCNLYAKNDNNCSTLNKFYNYGKIRVSQGFYGLSSLRSVPYSWYSR